VWTEILSNFLTWTEYVSALPTHWKPNRNKWEWKLSKTALAHKQYEPHLTHCSSARPHSPSKTAAQSFYTFSHSNATKSPSVKMGRPISDPKVARYHEVISTPTILHNVHHWTHPTQYLKWHPDPVSHFLTVHWTNTHWQTQKKCGKWPLPIAAYITECRSLSILYITTQLHHFHK